MPPVDNLQKSPQEIELIVDERMHSCLYVMLVCTRCPFAAPYGKVEETWEDNYQRLKINNVKLGSADSLRKCWEKLNKRFLSDTMDDKTDTGREKGAKWASIKDRMIQINGYITLKSEVRYCSMPWFNAKKREAKLKKNVTKAKGDKVLESAARGGTKGLSVCHDDAESIASKSDILQLPKVAAVVPLASARHKREVIDDEEVDDKISAIVKEDTKIVPPTKQSKKGPGVYDAVLNRINDNTEKVLQEVQAQGRNIHEMMGAFINVLANHV